MGSSQGRELIKVATWGQVKHWDKSSGGKYMELLHGLSSHGGERGDRKDEWK